MRVIKFYTMEKRLIILQEENGHVTEKIYLDNMGSDELIANLFRISQTEQKLKRNK